MPGSFEHMPSVAIRMPNGALASLAGNVDAHHKVAIADLVLVHSRVVETIEEISETNTARSGSSRRCVLLSEQTSPHLVDGLVARCGGTDGKAASGSQGSGEREQRISPQQLTPSVDVNYPHLRRPAGIDVRVLAPPASRGRLLSA